MAIASFLTTQLAGPWKEADFGSHLPPFIFFPIGTIAIVADLHDAGRPYKHHLVYGYGFGVSLAAFFMLVLEDSTLLPIAVGMSAQTLFMAIRLFEFSDPRGQQSDPDLQLQDTVQKVTARGKGAYAYLRNFFRGLVPGGETREQQDDSMPSSA
ncbi:hypothetical protein KC332_g8936 [Hortaea werneckii]|nr:hypothetical protein KC329_g9056 [Hortaea werneckii]KAI7270510.1 hypothetical protein KC335_g5608 [Hortaea werneckii]KAI7404167.1 hypothetical protein KC332_g8936 [Hortaea werneckii]KAI7428170.1 hypothetical protein KC336_g5662 [Hortaea werneckii]KAI7444818.1 hypothetical protein KC368_g8124 [Hortaea werneckii]